MSERMKIRRSYWVRSARPPGNLTSWELDELHQRIRYWLAQGMSDNDVAMHAECSNRTVQRYRYARGLPANQIHKTAGRLSLVEIERRTA